jgi:hypothetical protein
MEFNERAEPKRHEAARQANSSGAVDGRRSTQNLFAVPGIEEARMTPWGSADTRLEQFLSSYIREDESRIR